MAISKLIAEYEPAVLLVLFLFGNSYLLLPATPDCCSADRYARVALLTGLLLLTTLAAAAILLLSLAQANAYKLQGQGGWKLRSLLLLGIGLAAASTFIAFHTFEAGYGYRNGCVYCRDSATTVLMVILALEHAGAALLVAVALD